MQNWLKLGDWNAICDSCGRKFKASLLRKRWDGMMVCVEDYESKHPQLSIRTPTDISVPPWVRPERAPDIFIEPCPVVGLCTTQSSTCFADMATADCALADNTSLGYQYLLSLIDPPLHGTFFSCTPWGGAPYAGLGTASCMTVGNTSVSYDQLLYLSTPIDSCPTS